MIQIGRILHFGGLCTQERSLRPHRSIFGPSSSFPLRPFLFAVTHPGRSQRKRGKDRNLFYSQVKKRAPAHSPLSPLKKENLNEPLRRKKGKYTDDALHILENNAGDVLAISFVIGVGFRCPQTERGERGWRRRQTQGQSLGRSPPSDPLPRGDIGHSLTYGCSSGPEDQNCVPPPPPRPRTQKKRQRSISLRPLATDRHHHTFPTCLLPPPFENTTGCPPSTLPIPVWRRENALGIIAVPLSAVFGGARKL